ncbi:CapA family protein [bacterium]|nr:CapA family protein [candidate division CSSED10-310 bacterium]
MRRTVMAGLLPAFILLFTIPAAAGCPTWRAVAETLIHTGIIEPAPAVITFTGDVMLTNHVDYYLNRFGDDYPFQALRPWLDDSDLTIGNLESPVTARGEPFPDKRFTFRTKPGAVRSLLACPFQVCTLANNHMGDYGPTGVLDTLQHLDDAGILHAGAGRDLTEARRPALVDLTPAGSSPATREKPAGAVRIAVLAYSKTFPFEFFARDNKPGTADGDDAYLPADIAAARAAADLVVICVHWGAELMTTPKDYQTSFAHLAIDLGADLVIGNHPHVLQPLECYKGKLIAYSLGNFVFGSYSRKAVESILLRVMVRGGRLSSAEIVPISVDNVTLNFQPRPLRKHAAAVLLEYLRIASAPFNAPILISDDTGLINLE